MVYVWLIIGFICLIYGGNWLVDGSVKLAKRLGVSPLLIGLTLVGFGTSTPELITSLLAVFDKSEGIAVGNVVGSNIANILLVLGVAAVLSPVQVDLKSFRRDGTFLALSSLILVFAVLLGRIGHLMGFVMVGTLFIYVAYSYFSDKKQQQEQNNPDECGKPIMALGQTIIGISLTLLGAKLLVTNASLLAREWEISEKVIGLTIVAVGTSLPELITSIISAIHKHNDVAFGNVVGSNIYNALFILGLTAVFMPIEIREKMGLDLWVMMGATVALIGIALWKKRFSRGIGVLFLLAYAVYVWRLFI
ncbi:MAG: calcium/sodium antiporter [Alphaproteobacteria bacterium]|nr:calcium/sodium antiporter [Alphaproteobacteria bacterium]